MLGIRGRRGQFISQGEKKLILVAAAVISRRPKCCTRCKTNHSQRKPPFNAGTCRGISTLLQVLRVRPAYLLDLDRTILSDLCNALTNSTELLVQALDRARNLRMGGCWLAGLLVDWAGDASRGICQFGDLTLREDIVDTRATGLHENGGRPVELKEELEKNRQQCTYLRIFTWKSSYSIAPESHPRPCPNLVEQTHSVLPRLGSRNFLDEFVAL